MYEACASQAAFIIRNPLSHQMLKFSLLVQLKKLELKEVLWLKLLQKDTVIAPGFRLIPG